MSGKYTVISLFAGGGGSSLGYEMAGFKELLAIEYDKNAIETLKLNFDFDIWEKDITEIKDGEILKRCNIKKGELDILDGSPPCQGFSQSGKRVVNDLRNDLYKNYVKILIDLKPKVFIMENVPGMAKGTMKGRFNEILKELKSLNYNVKCKLMNAKYYNVPQSRERLIFIGVRKDLNMMPIFPQQNERIISIMESWKWMGLQKTPPLSKCFKGIVPMMKIGQTMADIIKKDTHAQTKRIYPNKPCPTIGKMICGIGFGAHIHPFEDRVLSIDEIKRVCSFPDDFILTGKYQEQKARLGNAVMPNMMKAIAEHIKVNILDKYYATR